MRRGLRGRLCSPRPSDEKVLLCFAPLPPAEQKQQHLHSTSARPGPHQTPRRKEIRPPSKRGHSPPLCVVLKCAETESPALREVARVPEAGLSLERARGSAGKMRSLSEPASGEAPGDETTRRRFTYAPAKDAIFGVQTEQLLLRDATAANAWIGRRVRPAENGGDCRRHIPRFRLGGLSNGCCVGSSSLRTERHLSHFQGKARLSTQRAASSRRNQSRHRRHLRTEAQRHAALRERPLLSASRELSHTC